jgi:hypothetical protein
MKAIPGLEVSRGWENEPGSQMADANANKKAAEKKEEIK